MPARDDAFTVLTSAEVYDVFRDQLRELGDPKCEWVRVDFIRPPDDLPELLERAQCVISRFDLTDDQYRRARRLKLFQLPIAGYEQVDLARAARHGVVVANNGGSNAVSVAEHVFLLTLTLFRQQQFHHRTVVDGSWINRKYENIELLDKTMGIVGLGYVGCAVAVRARAFGMRVLYHDIRPADPEFVREHALEACPFKPLVRASDVVTLHVPLTSRTRHMINRESLGWMKATAVLINTARGGIVDEEALYEALTERRLRGAGLDVFEEEPPRRDSPLLALDNVALSPHAGPSHESRFRMVQHVVANVSRVARGRVPAVLAIDYGAEDRG